MKKLLLTLVTIATVAFVGCKKEEIDSNGVVADIVNTSWSHSSEYTSGGETYRDTETFSFSSGGNVTFINTTRSLGVSGTSTTNTYYGSYVYTAPNIQIVLRLDETYIVSYTGTILGSMLSLEDKNGSKYIYYRD